MEQWGKDIRGLRIALVEAKTPILRYLLSSKGASAKFSKGTNEAKLKELVSYINFLLYGSDTEFKPSSVKTEQK